MKTIFPLIFTLLALSGCTSASKSERPVLAVSIPPQAQILSELTDSAFTIVSAIRPGTNPETYDPTISERMRLADAEAFFITGLLPFEQTLLTDLPEKVEIINVTTGIPLITGTHVHGRDADDSADVPDPHISGSYANAIIMARNFAQALCKLDPDRSSLYQSRLQSLTARLQAEQAQAAERIKASGTHAFAVWHPSLSYFARDFNLHQIAVGQESKELSLTSLSQIIEQARADSVRIFFFQKEYDSRQAQNINSAIGSRLITIDPLAQDWEAQLKLITDALSANN